MYKALRPRLIINKKLININNYKYINNNYHPQIPSEEKKEKAKIYQNKIDEIHQQIKNDIIINEKLPQINDTNYNFFQDNVNNSSQNIEVKNIYN